MHNLKQGSNHSARTPSVTIDERGELSLIAFEAGSNGSARHDAVLQFFNHEFRERTQRVRWVLVDLHSVAILDSSCLGVLMEVHSRCTKVAGALVLCGISSARLREVLAITCFDRVLPVVRNREAAFERFRALGAALP